MNFLSLSGSIVIKPRNRELPRSSLVMIEPNTIPGSSVVANQRWEIFIHALLFVLGFSLVFTIGWGGAVTVLGQLFGHYKYALGRIGGVVVILFGLATLDIIRIPWFYA